MSSFRRFTHRRALATSVSPDAPVIRLHDPRHTSGTLLIAAGIPAKVVSERLGHANSTFTIETYQHVLPGMGADAARTMEHLLTDNPPATPRRRNAG